MTDTELDMDREVHAAATQSPSALIERLRTDPAFMELAQARLARYAAMEKAGRLAACWISRRANTVLSVAMSAAHGGQSV